MRSLQAIPPRLAEWLLTRTVPRGPVGRTMLGDAREEFETAAARSGLWKARVTYWALVLSVCLRFIPDRLLLPRPSGRGGLGSVIHGTMSDLRHAARLVVQRPGLTATAVVTMALGTAAPATMYSIASGVLSDLPFEEGDRVVAVQLHDPVHGYLDMGVAVDDFRMWSAQQSTLDDLAATVRQTVQVSRAPPVPPALLQAAAVTPNTFGLLRVSPVLGRPFGFADARPGSLPVVIIGYRVWQDLFDGEQAALGADLRVNDQMRTIVGVMPEGFEFPFEEEIWMPLPTYTGADVQPFSVFGRLRVGVTLETAAADFDAIARRMSEQPEVAGERTISVLNYARAGLGPDASSGVIMMYALTFLMSFVLLIACVNVANLLLARTLGRTKEIAVRMALGAGRARIVRQLLAESLVLSVFGGAIGIILAVETANWFNDRIAMQINLFWIVVQVDAAVLAFCVGLIAVAAVLSGLLPAWQASRIDLRSSIDDASRGSTGFRAGRMNRILVTVEIALSCALLIVSGLMVRGVLNMVAKDLTFGQEQVLTGRILLQNFDYEDVQARRIFWDELQQKIQSQPGVQTVAITTRLPGLDMPRWRIDIPGLESEGSPLAARIETTASFFEMFDVHLIQGRLFSDSDTENTVSVAVVTPAFAEELYQDANAVGRRFRFSGAADTTWITVVGVVEDSRVFSRGGTIYPGVYQPLRQTAPQLATLALRTEAAPLNYVASVRADLASIDPHLPLHEVDTLLDRLVEASRFERTMGVLFGTFGIVALVMATVGLYGVVSYGITSRRVELGIRKALGAQRVAIVWVAIRSAIASLSVGVGAGVGGALILAPAVREALFGRSPTDLSVYGVVVLTLSVAALTAALIPSIRAAHLEPVSALRG